MAEQLPGLPQRPEQPPRLVASVYLQFVLRDGAVEAQPTCFVPPVAVKYVSAALEGLAKQLRKEASPIITLGNPGG